MPIPTQESLPRLKESQAVAQWAEHLVNRLEHHIKFSVMPVQRIILVNGNNNNVDVKGGTLVIISGPTAAFTVTGISGGTAGKKVVMYNSTNQSMTFARLSAGSEVRNQIDTLAAGNILTSSSGAFTVVHDGDKWRVIAAVT